MTSHQKKKPNIPTFVCPDVGFRPSLSSNVDSSSSKRKRLAESNEDGKIEDIRSIFQTIAEFNANEMRGKSREKLKIDKLTALGAPIIKQQKVPFKMQMARLRAKNVKNMRSKEILMESGVVAAKSSKSSQAKLKANAKLKKKKLSGHDSIQPKVGVKTVKGVYRVNKI